MHRLGCVVELKCRHYRRGDFRHKYEPGYSRGIRQRLRQLANKSDWKGWYNIKIGTQEELPGDYSEMLSSAKFCLVAPGEATALPPPQENLCSSCAADCYFTCMSTIFWGIACPAGQSCMGPSVLPSGHTCAAQTQHRATGISLLTFNGRSLWDKQHHQGCCIHDLFEHRGRLVKQS